MIDVARSDRTALITLARPDKRNALNDAGYETLARALRRLDADAAVRALVVTGAGSVFCGGTDLAELETHWPQAPDGPVMGLLRAVSALETPLIAAVNGPAVGIGATLLLHCDWVIMAPGSWMRFPFVELGIAPEGAATKLLPARIGRLRAMEVLLTGRCIDALEAAELGLATSIKAEPAVEAQRIADRIAGLPPEAVTALKTALREDCAADGTFWNELSVINRLLAHRGRPMPRPL